MAGVVLGVESLPTGLHTLTLVEKEPTWTQGTLGYRRTPTGSTRAVADWGEIEKDRNAVRILSLGEDKEADFSITNVIAGTASMLYFI